MLTTSTMLFGQDYRTICGRVIDENSKPLANATISCDNEIVFTTGTNGQFECKVSVYSRTIEVTAANYDTESASIDGSFLIIKMSLSKEYIAQQKMKKQAEADDLARKERQNIVNTIQNDSSQSIPFDTIIYTTLDNTPLSLRADLNGIVSNTYVDGYGVVQFSGPIYTIRKDLFSSCVKLTSITIPECVSSIEADAFHGCTNLQTVNISSLASWCMIDFASAKSTPLYYGATLMLNKQPIEIVHIPQNITTIKDFAFANNESIKEVYIHEYVQYIGRCAFNGCQNLKIVKFDGTTPPKIGGKAFGRNNSERLIYVPSESVERYQYKSGWIELFYHIKGY